MPDSASPTQIQTRRSGRISSLKEEGNVGLKRPAEVIAATGRARLKVDGEDEREDIKTIQIPIPTSEYERGDVTNLQVAISSVETLEDEKETIGCATELETRGTTSSGARGVRPTGRLSWAEFVKLPCRSSEIHADRDRGSCAVSTPKPGRAIDEMVQPKGPTFKSSLPKPTPKPNQQTKSFDLTGPGAFGEPPPKRLKTTESGLGFPHTRITSDDLGARGYEKRNTGVPRNGSGSAASSVQPEHRSGNALDSFHTVDEYNKVQNMLHGTVSGKGKRYKSEDQSRGVSRPHTHDISDDDPIQDEDPDVMVQHKPQSGGYKGTAGLMPARSKEARATASKKQRRLPDIASSYFQSEGPAFSASQRPLIGGGSTVLTPRMKDRMQSAAGNKRPSVDIEDISDDDGSAKRPRRGSNPAEVESASLSQAGNIKSSFPMRRGSMFTKTSVVEAERSRVNFPVALVKAVSDCYMHETEEERPACYLWNRQKEALQLSREGRQLHPTLALGMNKIQKVTCSKHPQSDGLFLIRQRAPLPNMILVKMSEPSKSVEFLEFLKQISPDATILPHDRMASIFAKQCQDLDDHNFKQRNFAGANHEIPPDIALLERRREARSQESLEGAETISRPRKTLANSMDKAEHSTRGRTYGQERPRISQSTVMDRPATRSTRSQRIELHRSPSPRPELWTDANRSWRDKYWKRDEPLIYPENGDKRATVDRQDVVRLNEGEFLNDNLLQFYLRYLEENIKRENPAVAKRVLFMNPFFYQRLTTGKGKSYIDYDGVKRWTSKFDIFKFDYVIVPVNEHAHWYLAVICNTPAFLKPPQEEEPMAEDNDTSEADTSLLEVDADVAPAEKKAEADSTTDVEEKVGSMTIDESDTIRVAEDETATKGLGIAPKQKKKKRKSLVRPRRYKINEPRIITMDSLGYPHSPTCSHLREFLIAEAKARHGVDVVLREKSVGMTAKNIPEQNNHCDCGLFLLGYVEYFLQNPDGMMHDLMQQKPEVMERFAKLDAHKMRSDIRQLLFKLKKEQIDRQQAEKQEKIARRRAKEASEASGCLLPSAEPTPAASPEISGTTSSDDKGGVALNASLNSPNEPAEEESIIEVEKPATPAAMKAEKRSSSEDVGLDKLMDDYVGFDRQHQEVHRQHLPNSPSVEYIADQSREGPLPAPPVEQEHKPQTSRSVEYMGQTRSSPAGNGSEITARKVIKSGGRPHHLESLPSSSDEESEPEVTMETCVKKNTPLKRDSTMSPLPAPSAFKGTGQKVGKIGPPRAARGPSSDLDAPRKHSVVDLEEESDDLPSQPTARELRTRPKESLPPKQQHTPSKKSTPPSLRSESKAKDDEEVEIPVKKFTPKPRSEERVAARRAQNTSERTTEKGAKHIKFTDKEDEEMIMNGHDEDSSQDSLMRGMSPTLLSSAKKLAVEIPPDASSEVHFSGAGGLPKSLVGLPNLPMRNATSPPRQYSSKSSPSQTVRSSPRNARKHSSMGNDYVKRPHPPILPPKKSPIAASSPSQGRRPLQPTTKHYTPSGSSRQNSKTPDGGKGRAEEPIELD